MSVSRIYRVLALPFLSFLIGCWGTGEHGKEYLDKVNQLEDVNASADFYVLDADGESTTTEQYKGEKEFDGEWETTRYKVYHFKACLRDRNTKVAIPKQRFTVKDGDRIYETATDENSCLTWTEDPLRFNFYAKSTYLLLERQIVGSTNGLYKGTYNLRFLVNPWGPYRQVKQKITEIFYWPYDLPSPVAMEKITTGSREVSEALNGTNMKSEDYARLVIHSPQFTASKKSRYSREGSSEQLDSIIREVKEVNAPGRDQGETSDLGFVLDVDLSMTPEILVRNINGELAKLEISRGKFKVFHEVVATDLGEKDGRLILSHKKNEVLSAGSPPSWATIKSDGKLHASTQTSYTMRVTTGELKLAIRVVPQEGPWVIEPYEGLFHIGNHSKLVGKNSLSLKEDSEIDKFNFIKFLEDTDEFQKLKELYLAHDGSEYDFSIASGNYETVAPGETATQRTVLFRAKTCVFDNANYGLRVKRQQFVIYRGNDNKRLSDDDAKTDDEGCLNVAGEVSHAFYKKEELIPVVYKIHKAISEDGGKILEGKHLFDLTILVNPWDDKFTFFRDSRVVADELAESLKRQKIESRFFISNFSYQTLRFSYHIDSYLNLTVKKMVLFSMEPKVLRYNSIQMGRNAVHELRDGIYLMKVAFQKDYLDPATKGLLIERNKKPGEGLKDLFKATLVNPNNGEPIDLNDDKDYRYKKQYISIVKKLVRVNAGRIITPVELDIRDLRLMRIRSQLLVQLEPIDERLLQVANRFDQNFSVELKQRWIDRYDQMIEEYAQKYGRDQANKLEEDLKKLGPQLRDIDLFRALSDEDEEEVLRGEIAQKQQELDSLIENLKEEQEIDGRNQRVVDDPEAFRKMLVERNLYTEEFKNDLARNDFTVIPAAPLMQDLDVLIEKPQHSGLAARTFIGPITFILNSNHSALRPTDTLDSTWCPQEDCNSVSFDKKTTWGLSANRIYFKSLSGQYRNKKYYQSVSHLAGVQVDNLIETYFRLRDEYDKEMFIKANIGNFVNRQGYKFVSLRDEVVKTFDSSKIDDKDCNSFRNEKFLDECMKVDTTINVPHQKFIEKYNKTVRGPEGMKTFAGWNSMRKGVFGPENKMSKSRLREIVMTGKMDEYEGYQFCWMFFEDLFASDTGLLFESEEVKNENFAKLKEICTESAMDPDKPFPFIVERRLRVKELGANFVFNGGKQMNLNVGSSIGYSKDEKFAIGSGANFNALGRLMGEFISTLTSALRASIDYNRGKGYNEGTQISEATFLVMQAATFDLQLTKYEHCAAIKWNPDVFTPTFLSFFNGYLDFHRAFKNFGKDIYMPGGYFVCTGVDEPDPGYVRENYFYFTQHFTDGDMLDNGDLYNHPWLLGLRGVRDVSAFITRLGKDDFVLSKANDSPRDSDRWPLKKMIDTYLKTDPSFPGMYTVLPEYPRDYPRNNRPEEAFKELTPATLDMENFTEELMGIRGFDDIIDMTKSGDKKFQEWEERNKISSQAAQILLNWIKFTNENGAAVEKEK